MPIYAYRCEECGFAKDVLQKMSDDPLTVCLSCGKSSFKKQVTAAGFQLKGSGWYVTDFRNNSGATAAPASAAVPGVEPTSADSGASEKKSSEVPAATPSSTTTAPAASPVAAPASSDSKTA